MKADFAVAAVRVSSTKQGLQGDSHEQQMDQIELRRKQLSVILGSEIKIVKTFKFTQSASGEIASQPIKEVIEYVKQNPGIKYFFIKSVDRFTRAGSTMYGLLKSQLARYGVRMVDCYGIISNQNVNTLEHLDLSYDWSTYQPSYVTEILEAERSKADVRDILTRLIGSQIGYVRQGYRVRQAPPGLQNTKIDTEHGKRVILTPHPVESPWFIRIFELCAQGNLSYPQIVSQVNAMGYKSRKIKKHDPQDKTRIIGFVGENPLTVKQLQRFIQNPIYAGVASAGKWTAWRPVKERFEGLVPISLWNMANKGRLTIVEDADGIRIVKGALSPWQKPKRKDNPDFSYRREILCPFCRKPLYGAFTKRGRKLHGYYFCHRRDHKRWEVKQSVLHEGVKELVSRVEFSEETFRKIKDKILSKWEERRLQLGADSLAITGQLQKLKTDRQAIIEKIKILSSATVIKEMEDEVEELNQQIEQTAVQMKKNTLNEISVQEIINTVYYFYEHFEDLLLGGPDPTKNAAMFGLLFEEPPTYDDLVLRTVKLAPLFKLKDQSVTTQNLPCELTVSQVEPLFDSVIRTYYKLDELGIKEVDGQIVFIDNMEVSHE